MPRLNTYIEVGFCSGYGDGDYRVSCAIEKFSRKKMDELIAANFHAMRAAWDMWSRAQQVEQGGATEQPQTGESHE